MSHQEVLFDTPSLMLSYNRASQCLHAEWKGYHDASSIVAGCAAMRQSLSKQPCTKVLDDTQNITSSWDEVAEWVGKYFFRIMAQHGVRYFAWIYPTDPASRQSVELAFSHARHTKIALFDDTASAYAWLQHQ